MSIRLFKALSVTGLMTSLSRGFGLIRDIIIAKYFGASPALDAFIVAFRIPNFFRRLFAEGSFSNAFIPILSEYKVTKDNKAIRTLLNQTLTALGGALIITTIIGVLSAPIFIWVFAHGLTDDPTQYMLAKDMLKITFPYILFISLTAFAGGIMNTYGHFAIPAFTPVLLNLSLICVTIWLSPMLSEPIIALAIGVLIAGILQLLIQLPFLWRFAIIPIPTLKQEWDGVKRILRLMVPTLFAATIMQINLLIDTLIASFLVKGSISWLYFSDRLLEFPIGVFGVALATVISPTLAKSHAKNTNDYSTTLDWALRWVLVIGLPATIGLTMLSFSLMSTIFQYQSFTIFDVHMAANSLIAYALGLPFFLGVKILSAAYFSKQDAKTPVKIAIAAMITNVIFNLILVNSLAHVGLALATTLASTLQLILLYLALYKQKIYQPKGGWCIFFIRLLCGCAGLAGFLYYLTPSLAIWSNWDALQRILKLIWLVVVGGGIYFLILWLVGVRKRDLILSTHNL